MGLTIQSVGVRAVDGGLVLQRQSENDRVVAIAGNPNVGKSTVFNGLTGMNQHTGNWPGKTVASAQGYCKTRENAYVLVDIPGTYSLLAHSAEEEVARNFLCFGDPDAIVVVCDATCLERNLNLVLQTLEISEKVVVCVNLMDEAKRKHIRIDLNALSERLGVPVVGTTARKKGSLAHLTAALDRLTAGQTRRAPLQVAYSAPLEAAISFVEYAVRPHVANCRLSPRFLSLKLLDAEDALLEELRRYLGFDLMERPGVAAAVARSRALMEEHGITRETLKDQIVSALVRTAEAVSAACVRCERQDYAAFDRRLDRILTSRRTGYPIMLLLLALILFLTITGANYPSALLSAALFHVQDLLTQLFALLHAPDWLHGALVLGVYRVLAWVVSVMLPPMAIFFPLFTLLEDAGYLPRIAYNLDRPFQRCRACGKQALTMWVVDKRMQRYIAYCLTAACV